MEKDNSWERIDGAGDANGTLETPVLWTNDKTEDEEAWLATMRKRSADADGEQTAEMNQAMKKQRLKLESAVCVTEIYDLWRVARKFDEQIM